MLSSQQEETQPHLSPRFRFKPGFDGDAGSFMPSIACLEQMAPCRWVPRAWYVPEFRGFPWKLSEMGRFWET
jgi:hypothetical protein